MSSVNLTQKTVRAPADLFNEGLEAFKQGELERSVASFRSGFFENLYITPLLLGEDYEPQAIWYPGPLAEPPAAQEYVSRFRAYWQDSPEATEFLGALWNDPLVRNELKSYINLCKSLGRAGDDRQRSELFVQRQRYVNPERIRRTQQEILQRLARGRPQTPADRPFLGLIMLSSTHPAESVEFYRKLFEIEPIKISEVAGGYAEFELHGVHIAIHGYNQHGHGDPYRLGPPPSSLGWGAFFVIRVSQFDRYYDNAVRSGVEILDRDVESVGGRFFVVKDPSGYVFEITEEELRGLVPSR